MNSKSIINEVRQSQELYSNIFNKMFNGFALHEIILDKKGIPCDYRFIEINPAFEQMTGLKKDKIIGKTVLDILPKTEKYWIETYGKVALEGESIKFVNYSNELDKYFEVIAYCPKKGYFATIFNDITDNKINENKLLKIIEDGNRVQFELSNMIYATQALLELEDFQKVARRLFDVCRALTGAKSGYVALLNEDGSENEVLFLESGGLPCTVDPYLPMPIRGLRGESYKYCKAVYDNDFMNSEWIKFMPAGHVDLKNVIFVPLIINGKAVGLIGLANKEDDFNDRDVSLASAIGRIASMALANSRNMGTLKKSEEKYRELVENASSIITKYDKKGTILSMNEYGLKFFGYKEEELIGKNLIGTITPKIESTGRDLQEFLSEVFSNLEKYPQNINENIKKNGEPVWVLWTNRPIKDENGNIIELFSVGTDVTDRKIAEDNIKRLNETLSILNKILRHDIANNLTVTSMALELIETKDHALKEKAERSIAKSVELIEKIRGLEFAASNEKTTGNFDVKKVIERIIKNYPETSFNIQGSGEVIADEALEPVIDNIIRNAIVHGKTDRIDIEIGCNNEICEIKISDYGKGIPDEIKERIFEEGFSYGDSRSTGLGLYIVKNIIQKYGGEVRIEDNKPSGAVFTLKLKKA